MSMIVIVASASLEVNHFIYTNGFFTQLELNVLSELESNRKTRDLSDHMPF